MVDDLNTVKILSHNLRLSVFYIVRICKCMKDATRSSGRVFSRYAFDETGAIFV